MCLSYSGGTEEHSASSKDRSIMPLVPSIMEAAFGSGIMMKHNGTFKKELPITGSVNEARCFQDRL